MNYAINTESWVTLRGNRQNIRILSAQVDLPILLFLHGGPGVCDRHNILAYQNVLAESFMLVMWDQRGSGKSNTGSLKETVHVEDYIQDTIALIQWLCTQYNQDKLFIAGHSWGTILGLEAAARIPEKIFAYIGQGQFVNGAENERLSYEFCLKEAQRIQDKKAFKKLTGNAPVDGHYASSKAMMAQRDCLTRYGGANYKKRQGLVQSLLIPLIQSKEYRIPQIIGYALGASHLSKVLWDEVIAFKFDQTHKQIHVPVLLTMGAHDQNTPTCLAKEWFDQLDCPSKKFILFEHSAHSPIVEEPELWTAAVLNFCQAIKA